jgi:protein involved in polysaccharide export with SLBB domain
MRFNSFALLVCVSMAAAGCAQQPVAFNTGPRALSTSGVDNVVYGPTPASTPAKANAQSASRGLFAQAAPATSGSPPRLYMQAAPAAAPSRGFFDAQGTAAIGPSVTGSVASAGLPELAGPPPPARNMIYAQAAPPPGPPPMMAAPPMPDAIGPQPGPAHWGPVPPVTPAPVMNHYTLDSGDRLRVVVFGQEGLTNSYLVSATGQIDMPLIGAVVARGATSDQLSGRIAAKLREGYIREPHVAVEIEAYRPFFILGEVTQPGQYPYVANMTAETAIAIAGGFTPRAFRDDLVVSRTAEGVATRMTVPLNFPLRPGDTVSVQERWF